MSFDARSRERLAALGRTLPQKLPPPAVRQPLAPEAAPAARPRHRLESEQDPEALFHALLEASPDGSVPPHLLERLRSLEQAAAVPAGPAAPPATPAGPTRRRPQTAGPTPASRRASASDRDLYDAFDDLLRSEGDDSPDPLPPPSRRAPDPRLLPRPTLRSPRNG